MIPTRFSSGQSVPNSFQTIPNSGQQTIPNTALQTIPNLQAVPGPMPSQATRMSQGSWQRPVHVQPPPPKADARVLDRRPVQEQEQLGKETAHTYRPLMEDDAGNREEWIQRAYSSLCSQSIDDLFRDHQKQRKVQQLKQDMFDQIYETVGNEVAPEDLVSAVVVKNVKFHPCIACILSVLTLGVFCIFRPRDDDAVIVLTRQERVLLAKDERPSFCRGQALPALLMLLRYLIAMLLILSLPSIFFILAFKRGGHDAMNKDELQFVINVQMDLEKQFINRLRKNYALVGCMGAAVFMGLLFWLWIRSPQDYGTRVRQSHAASSVCGSQLCLTGSEYRRRGILRVFFGKFPTQAQMDSQMTLRSGQVVGPVRRGDATAGGLFGSSGFGGGRDTTPAALIAFTIMLSVVTLLDSSFAWIDRSWAVARVATMSEFCIEASTDPLVGRVNCTRAACELWAASKPEGEPHLCREVQWYDDPLDQQSTLYCEMYGHASPPCCGGCLAGGAMGYFSNGLEAFKSVLGVIADVGTLVFSFMAARHVMTLVKARDVVDLTFVRSPGFRSQTSNLEFTQPLAALFLHNVFQMGREKFVNTDPGPKGAEESGKKWGNGIKDFEISDAQDWDEFFSNDSLVLPGHSRWTSMVNVPRRCLGMLSGERALAAWTESPQVTLVHMLPSVAGSVILLLVMLLWPGSSSNDAFLIPKTGKGFGARALSSFVAALAFFLLSLATMHICIFRSVQHVVIVTDLRIFYVRYRPKCWCFCMFGLELRVDAFRHDSDVFFGRMNSTNLSCIQRMTGVRWVPGDVLMQMKYGMLQVTRARGDALDIYNVISQLTRKPTFLTRSMLEAAGVSWDECQDWLEDVLNRKSSEVWSIAGQEDDFPGQEPEIFLTNAAEQPIYHWSFKESGVLGSAHNTNTDVLVTTGRVLLWNRVLYKRFDCKISCCLLLGGICQCSLCNRLSRRRLPSSMSFVALSALMSFTTETTMEPPVWYDPEHPPVKVRCFDEACEAITRCVTCDSRRTNCSDFLCDLCPRRTGSRAQLALSWQVKWNAQQPQPDLECSVRPFALPNAGDVGLLTSLGLASAGKSRVDRQMQLRNATRLEVLHKIMGIVQGLNSRS